MMTLWKCVLIVSLVYGTKGAIEITANYEINTTCGDNNLAAGVNLLITCTYTLTNGDSLDTLQFRDANDANVFNSLNGNVAGGSLLNGWAAGGVTFAVSDTTITVNIPSYDETAHTTDVKCVGVTFTVSDDEDWADLPPVSDVPPDVPIASTTCTGGDTLSGVNEVSFDATSSIDTGVYPAPTIVCLLDNNVVHRCTSAITCRVTIASSGTVECYACLFNEESASRTTCEVAITVENQKVKELTATQCAGIWTATVTWKGPYSPKPILQWNRGGSETKCTDKEYKDSKDPKDKEHTRKCVRTFTHHGKVEVTVYVNGSKGISDSVTIIPWWLVFIIVIIIVAVVLTCVGLYCCKKHNICCWKKRTTDAPGVPYTVEVTTGDKNNAATSARVFIIMYGGKDGNRNSGKVWLEGGAFTRGHTAVFNVEVADMLSPLARIDIGHDNSGAVAGWFLDRVSVKCPSAGMEKMFRCDKWLAVDEGDGAIERTLYETTHKDKKKMDTSHKYKSSDHAN